MSVVNYEDSSEYSSDNCIFADDFTSITCNFLVVGHNSVKVGFKFLTPNGDHLNSPIYYFRMMLTSCAPFEDLVLVLGSKGEQRFAISDLFEANVHPTRCAPESFDIASDQNGSPLTTELQ